MKKLLVVGIIILLVGMSIPSTGINVEKSIASSNGNILYVGGSGPGNYSKIQDAIDNASDGDIVYVYNGTYDEGLSLSKTINLTGENNNITIINGYIEISADNVVINGFTIKQDIKFDAIFLQSNNNRIYSNIIKDVSRFGIYIKNSLNNSIQGNIIKNGYSKGIALEKANYNIITGNTIVNFRAGIHISDIHYCLISNNTISTNHYDGVGIGISDSSANDFFGNTISNNEKGISSFNADSKIYHNNFINNTFHAKLIFGEDTWDNGYPIGGNYWDDYEGKDCFYGEDQNLNGSDGIGDDIYQNFEKDISDRYPFIHPNGWNDNQPPLVESLSGPEYGKSGTHSFNAGVFDPDQDLCYIKFNWGDGSYSGWLGPVANENLIETEHSFLEGIYHLKVKARDEFGNESNWSDSLVIHIEDIAPDIKIIKPGRGLYIMNKKIVPRIIRRTMIIGPINITIDGVDDSGIDKVEFYIDNQLKTIDNTSPYSCLWGKDRLKIFHIHVIKIVAYDNAGNFAFDQMIVRRFL
jgi:parallel beta-helix repeat protein